MLMPLEERLGDFQNPPHFMNMKSLELSLRLHLDL